MKPILFNTDMVRAILEEKKTVTRRVIRYRHYGRGMKDIPSRAEYIGINENGNYRWKMGRTSYFAKPEYDVGSILYVRETWGDYSECEPDGALYYMYRADYPDGAKTATHPDGTEFELPQWHPSIHMPREAARLFLRVTSVRAERLQDITEGQAQAEGARSTFGLIVSPENEYAPAPHTAVEDFARIWDETIRSGDWDRFGFAANPWVWVVEFKRISKEEASKA